MRIVFGFIGWLCLLVWYRDTDKMEEVINEEYAGRYGNAGRVFVLNFIAGAGAIILTGCLIAIIVRLIYRAVVN